MTAVAAAAPSGYTPAGLAEVLDELGVTTDWAALRRVLAGNRDREQIPTGLDDIDTAPHRRS